MSSDHDDEPVPDLQLEIDASERGAPEELPTAPAPAPLAQDEEATSLSLESRLLKAFEAAHAPRDGSADAARATPRKPQAFSEERLPPTVPAPVLPRSEREVSLDPIVALPLAHVPPEARAALGAAGAPEASAARSPAPEAPAPPTPAPRRRWVALALLALLLALGFLERDALSAFGRRVMEP